MLAEPTVVNVLRNAAYSIITGRLHEISVLRIEHALRSGPLVVTEFDGLTIDEKAVVSEVKKKVMERDVNVIAQLIEETRRDLQKRVKMLEAYRKTHSKIVIFHDPMIDTRYLKEKFSEIDLTLVPVEVGRLPRKPPEDVNVLHIVYALIIEFLSMPRLTCRHISRNISCNSPPYDANIYDLKDALLGKEPNEFSRRLADQASDVERLQRLHPCAALYAVAFGLRVRGRRESLMRVIDKYREAIKYIFNLPIIDKHLSSQALFIAHAVERLVSLLQGDEKTVIIPKSPRTQQETIEVDCLQPPEKLLVLLEDAEEAQPLADLLLSAFTELKQVYVLNKPVLLAFEHSKLKRLRPGLKVTIVGPHRDLRAGKMKFLEHVDVLSTDFYLSLKRGRRMMRDVHDHYLPPRVIVLHRGIVPPSATKRREMGRHSLEVM